MASIKGMLARPDFVLPLAAAERQFRDHYYGLNSAALLEDLFFDALGNFVRQTAPEVKLSRPPTGQKGWDYQYDTLQISHKVSQGLGDIAALWDATKVGVTSWSFDEPIVYVLGSNAPKTKVRVVTPSGASLLGRSVADLGRPYVADGRTLLVVHWPTAGQPEVLEVAPTQRGQTVEEALPFGRVWRHVADHVNRGGRANEIEVLCTNGRKAVAGIEPASLINPAPLDISVERRSGIYLLRKDLLQNLPVKTNNRAILIPSTTVKLLLEEAAIHGLFAPLPLWYWVYAEERPPDMYAAQRAEFDARFSARGISRS